MASLNGSFRPELVSLRRRMFGYSQGELAELAGIAQGTLSKIEQGLKEVSEELLEKLAKSLDCPAAFFFQAEREYGPPMSAHPMFRKKTSVGQKVLDRIIAEMNVRLGHTRKLLSTVEFTPELTMPEYDVDDFDGDIETIADNVRRAWYVPQGPIRSLTEFIERAGCLVVQCDMEAARIDGMSYRIPGLPPVIFLNKAQPADRMRFSLAHELGHIILHRYPSPNMEKEADEFASAFLMPRADIGPELIGLTLEKAAYMKPVWRASMASLIYRATTLEKIDRSKADYMWRQMSLKGFRTREPASLDFEKETPSLVSALLDNLTKRLGYTPSDLEDMLHLRYSELAKLYGLEQQSPSPLRMVK